MSDLTYHPVGLYPDDKANVAAVRQAVPALGSTAETVRFALARVAEMAAMGTLAETPAKPRRKRAARGGER